MCDLFIILWRHRDVNVYFACYTLSPTWCHVQDAEEQTEEKLQTVKREIKR